MRNTTPTTEQIRWQYAYGRTGSSSSSSGSFLSMFNRWLEKTKAETEERVLRRSRQRIEAMRVFCPTHRTPDCSLYVNGCSEPDRIKKMYIDAIEEE